MSKNKTPLSCTFTRITVEDIFQHLSYLQPKMVHIVRKNTVYELVIKKILSKKNLQFVQAQSQF